MKFLRVAGFDSVSESAVAGSKSVIFGSNVIPSSSVSRSSTLSGDIFNDDNVDAADDGVAEAVGNSRIMCELEPNRSGNG